MEQLAARWAHNPKVVGSSPAPATKNKRRVEKSVLLFYFYEMKYFVYVIYSEQHDKIYIGMTSNLQKRVFAHNNLPKGWTQSFRPWKLVHSEEFLTKSEALKREKELKSHWGRDFIREEIL